MQMQSESACSLDGICRLIVLIGIRLCWLEEKKNLLDETEQKACYWRVIKKFITDKYLLKTVESILAIILGVTIAIWLGDVHAETQQREKTIELLDVAKSEVKTSIGYNTSFIEWCENNTFELWMLKLNVDCRLGTLEKVLENDDLIVTMSGRSYGVFCNYTEMAKDSYEAIRDSAENDTNVIKKAKALNNELTILFEQIEAEIKYLNKEISIEELENMTEEITKIDGVELTPEEASAMMEEMRSTE